MLPASANLLRFLHPEKSTLVSACAAASRHIAPEKLCRAAAQTARSGVLADPAVLPPLQKAGTGGLPLIVLAGKAKSIACFEDDQRPWIPAFAGMTLRDNG
jgi:hypothetical protein